MQDGCSGQYKSANAFHDIAVDTKVVPKNYFGSCHGKSQYGVVTGYAICAAKHTAKVRDVIITDAESLHRFVKSKLDRQPRDCCAEVHHFSLRANYQPSRRRPEIQDNQGYTKNPLHTKHQITKPNQNKKHNLQLRCGTMPKLRNGKSFKCVISKLKISNNNLSNADLSVFQNDLKRTT